MKSSLTTVFKNNNPTDLNSSLDRYACVSIILRGLDINELEVAFIQRAFNPKDRWSGHIAFPGGTKEQSDRTDFDAAIRETIEEVGIILTAEEMLGRLNDVQARGSESVSDFFIRPFVFYTKQEIVTSLNPSEVADFFWMPIKEIENPSRQTLYHLEHPTKGRLSLPAVDLGRNPPLWGLTYLMVLNLLEQFKRL